MVDGRDKVDFDHGVRFVFRFFWDGRSVGFEVRTGWAEHYHNLERLDFPFGRFCFIMEAPDTGLPTPFLHLQTFPPCRLPSN